MYAIKGNSWRAVNTSNDLLGDEILSETIPSPTYDLMLSPSQQIILANGDDAARVILSSGEPGASVEITVNGEPFTITLDESGSYVIEIACETPNTTLVVQAGTAKAVIFAVEVPA